MALTISRVSALPTPLVVNTIYMVAISATELQVVVVGNSIADVRKTILTTDVNGKISTALDTAASDASAKAAGAISTAAADATAKANAAQTAAIAAAATDATTKHDSAVATAALDATAKTAAATSAAATDASTKATAAKDAAIAAAATDATTKVNAALATAEGYTDNAISVGAKALADAAQTAAIAAAATDATTKANAAQSAASTDATAKVATALTTAKTYTDTTVNNAIGNLDMSNTAVYAADIPARNALVMTKNSFVLVANATGDATVGSGAALYFYLTTDHSFMKIAEYESMDLVIPNQDILENLSVTGGVLLYNGEPLGTVVAGSTDW